MTQQLEQLESQSIQIWEFLTSTISTPTQLERLYLKVLVYIAAYEVNASIAAAATAKPGVIGGSAEAYRSRVLQISADIADAGITNPSGNNIIIHLLAKTGQPSTTLLNLVQSTMQSDANRMVCDVVAVQPATAQNYALNASITLSQTANEEKVKSDAIAALKTYTDGKQMQLGADIIRSDVIDILRNFPEIVDAVVSLPATNIAVPPQSYAACTATAIVVSGRA